METHSEIDWRELTRQAIQETIETLEPIDELTSESELTESNAQETADKINDGGHERVDRTRRSDDEWSSSSMPTSSFPDSLPIRRRGNSSSRLNQTY